ncbi:unnamed protein product [Prunus armeniaca]|uniref:DNA-directed RNA polymerase n=1 Tax=Prunus armeniaca TaxID=36596 RepID=A0A6J5TYR7_PRUAR|nr:unnamed protein product [Prunus armeniaca]
MGVAQDSSANPPKNNKQKSNDGKQIPHSAIDKEFLAAPIKSATDKFALLPEFLKVRGLVKQHLDSFNYFVNTGIKKIVRANDRIVSGVDPSIYLRFKDISIGEPSLTMDGVTEKIAPHTCRLSDMTYSAPIKVDVEYIQGSHDQKTRVEIGRKGCLLCLRSCSWTLYGKTESELAKLGECPLDPGGYFIIKGNEKIPIMVVMKAMGMESDQEVVQMVGRDPRYSALLMPSIEDCAKEGIHKQEQALAYLETKVKRFSFAGASSENDGRVMTVLQDVFLANVEVCQDNFRPKCIYVAVMLRRIMDAILNKDAMDDKDYVGNKRIELSGQLISLLFEDLFKTMIAEVKKAVDNILTKPSRSSRFDFAQEEQKQQTSLKKKQPAIQDETAEQ